MAEQLIQNETEVAAAGRRWIVPMWVATIAVACVGLNLRPGITAVAPVLDQARADLGVSSTVAGLVTTTPLLCFVVLSSRVPRVARRWGLERTVMAAMGVLALGFAVRMIPGIAALFVGMVLIGVGIVGGNILLPTVIKRDYPRQSGGLMAIYTASLFVGPALAAGLTLPIQHAFDLDWRAAISTWGLLVVVGALSWLPMLRTRGAAPEVAAPTSGERGTAAVPGLWRMPLAWAVTLYFAANSLVFYTVSAWLPEILVAGGVSTSVAGFALSLTSIVALVPALLVAVFAPRRRHQLWVTVPGAVVTGVGLLGMLIVPGTGTLLWVVILGVGIGVTSAMAFSLPVLRARSHGSTAELNGMAQTVGYAMSASGPVLAGLLHDLTGGWTALLAALVAVAAMQAICGRRAGADVHVDATAT
ncbi:CynX/NimT family MFS transporter [Gordonia sp. (in: high G+C Gram-positive bacteria)]|uniref:CynX/NimT family MFS transporter n=1 Tax=Gordonia sp. (in: high G+C Gram-positive bacteria) TaxID=84139 RepID=UPI003F9855F0